MAIRKLDPEASGHDEDWEGNNAAFRCPCCGKTFIVSELIHLGPEKEKGCRACPECGLSVGRVRGGRKSGGEATIESPD